jgi:hypothetical protein
MGPAINSSDELVYVTTPSKYGSMAGIGGIDVKANLYKPFILTELGYSTINITNTKYPSGITFGPPAGTYTPSVNTNELSVATLLPNKKLIMASGTLQNISTAGSTASQYILDITKNNPTFYRVGDVTIQSPPSQYPAIYTGPNFFKRWEYPGAQSANTVTGGFTVLTGNKVGKIIVSLIQGSSTTPIRGCYEIMSVKGFYVGVSEFDLIPTLKNPINLATLATSDYNLYFNQPVKSLGNG